MRSVLHIQYRTVLSCCRAGRVVGGKICWEGVMEVFINGVKSSELTEEMRQYKEQVKVAVAEGKCLQCNQVFSDAANAKGLAMADDLLRRLREQT